MDVKTIAALIIGLIGGGLIVWLLSAQQMSDAPPSAAANGAAPPCHARVRYCITIPLEDPTGGRGPEQQPSSVADPHARGNVSQPPIEGPVTTEPAGVQWQTLRFGPAMATGHADSADLHPTGCHYWVEFNQTYYKVHC